MHPVSEKLFLFLPNVVSSYIYYATPFSNFMRISHYFSLLQLNVHPLTYGVLFFIAGIYTANCCAWIDSMPIIIFSILLTPFFAQSYLSKQFLIAWCALFFVLGFGLYRNEYNTHLYFQKKYAKQQCSINGWIIDKASLPLKKLNTTTLLINQIGIKGSPLKHIGSYTIRIYSHDEMPYRVGDKISLNNITLPAAKPSTSSVINFLVKNGVLFSLFISSKSKRLRKLYSPHLSVQRAVHHMRNTVYQKIQKGMSVPVFSYFSSLFLGNRVEDEAANASMVPLFKDWGISHFLARSGLHLVIIVSMWEYLLTVLPIGYLLKQIVLLIMTLLYALLSWTSISFMRALITLLYTKLSSIGYNQVHAIHAISIVALVILAYNPACLFFPDFQLSFFLTLCLMWFNRLRYEPQKVLN